jgi:hypothetical protein
LLLTQARLGKTQAPEGYGFYLTTDKETASGYKPQDSGSLAELYVRMEKPLSVNQKNFTEEQLTSIVSEMVDAEIAKYPDEISDYKDGFLSNYVDTYSTNRKAAIREVVSIIGSGNEKAVDQIAELANASGSKSIVFDAVTKATGFDGVVADGYGGRGEAGGTIYVAWNPTQIKSVDNQGTFDPSNTNIYKSGLGCGANAEGGGGFQPGNSFARGDGAGGESGSSGCVITNAKEAADAIAKEVIVWAEKMKQQDRLGGEVPSEEELKKNWMKVFRSRKLNEGDKAAFSELNPELGRRYTRSRKTE